MIAGFAATVNPLRFDRIGQPSLHSGLKGQPVMCAERSGTLYLVVGPSGAGKDALLGYAGRALADTHIFPRRVVTRRADAGGEDHEAMTAEAFAALRASGGFVLSWEAHGLNYGIRSGVTEVLGSGHHVVCNVSRSVIDVARRRFRTVVIAIDADPAIRAVRLRTRGRESASDMTARLHRQAKAQPDITIMNDGALETAQKQFVAILTETLLYAP